MFFGDMFFCDYCGFFFENMYDLYRYVKCWCLESFFLKRKWDDENDED